jgi:GT2 family glycosyltransferase
MGISKKTFELTGGFSNIHPGEDPDLSLRISKLDLISELYNNVIVYHKRRVNIFAFFNQVFKFGMVRPIINKWHPTSNKLIFWFPSFVTVCLLLSIVLVFFKFYFPLCIILLYFLLIFFNSLIKNKSLKVGFYSIFTSITQFIGYGLGFMKSNIILLSSNKDIQDKFPSYFFKKSLK